MTVSRTEPRRAPSPFLSAARDESHAASGLLGVRVGEGAVDRVAFDGEAGLRGCRRAFSCSPRMAN